MKYLFFVLFLFYPYTSHSANFENGNLTEVKLPITALFAAIPNGTEHWFAIASHRKLCIFNFTSDKFRYKINCLDFDKEIKEIFIRRTQQKQYVSCLTGDKIDTIDPHTFENINTIHLESQLKNTNNYVLHSDIDGDNEDDLFICSGNKIYYFISSFQQQNPEILELDIASETNKKPVANELPISDCNEIYWHINYSSSKKIRILTVPHREGVPSAIAVISSDNISPDKINFIEFKKGVAPKVMNTKNNQFESITPDVNNLIFLKDNFSNKLDILINKFNPSFSQPGQIFPEVKYCILSNSSNFEYVQSSSVIKSIYVPDFNYFSSSFDNKFRLATIDSPLSIGSKEAFSDLLTKSKVSFRILFSSYNSKNDKIVSYAFPWSFEYIIPKDILAAQLNIFPLSLSNDGAPSILYSPSPGKWAVLISSFYNNQLNIIKNINIDIPSDFNFFSNIKTDDDITFAVAWINEQKTAIIFTKIYK